VLDAERLTAGRERSPAARDAPRPAGPRRARAAAPLAVAQAAEEQQALAAQDHRVVLDQQFDAVIGGDAGAIGARVGQHDAIEASFDTAMIARHVIIDEDQVVQGIAADRGFRVVLRQLKGLEPEMENQVGACRTRTRAGAPQRFAAISG